MPAKIGCDAHKQFSVFVTIDGKGKTSPAVRVDHHRQEYIDFLRSLPPASEIALEATGHWYWMVDEMEKAGHRPRLANPTEAKKRMGKTNKTDALDAKGLAILLHNGTLPESWIPPGELRDRREPLRTRMALRDLRSSLKHRIHAAIDRYGLQATGISDLFGVKGRVYIDATLERLPRDTAAMIQVQLTSLDQLEVQIEEIEDRIAAALKPSPEVRLLRTIPGVGEILAPLVWLEIGDIERFPRAENLASYARLVPRIIASGGRIRTEEPAATSTSISSGDSSRPPPARCGSRRITAPTSNGSINGWLRARGTGGRWLPPLPGHLRTLREAVGRHPHQQQGQRPTGGKSSPETPSSPRPAAAPLHRHQHPVTQNPKTRPHGS